MVSASETNSQSDEHKEPFLIESVINRLVPLSIERDPRDPAKFFEFLRTVSIEALLADRQAQADLHYILDVHTTRDREFATLAGKSRRVMVLNPYPVLNLEFERGTYFEHRAFMLRIPAYYYYFHAGWPIENVPSFLREEDIVESRLYSQLFPEEVKAQAMRELGISEELFHYFIYGQDPRVTQYAVYEQYPFNKPINRVSVSGGEAERFNTVKWEWERNGDGVYKPDLRQKLRVVVR